MHTNPPCPLCLQSDGAFFHQDARRDYYRCPTCLLVFVAPNAYPSLEQEKAEYDLHQNDYNDPGYLRFLDRVCAPLVERIECGAKGLDYGCGPTPVLADMLHKAGMQMHYFDPIYYPDQALSAATYDFITCTEAVEHFHHPHREWRQLRALLTPGGILAIMTKRVIDAQRFAQWHYKNDPTHVCFYSEETFNWLAHHFAFDIAMISADVAFFKSHKT